MTTATTARIWWTSADGQGSIPMGDYVSREEAEAAIPNALAELLGQGTEDEDLAAIHAGAWSVDLSDD